MKHVWHTGREDLFQFGGNLFGLVAPIATGYIVAGTGSCASAFLPAGGLLMIWAIVTLTMTRRPVGGRAYAT